MVNLDVDFEWDNLEEAFAELERECTEVVRGLSVMVWNSILIKTPQFAGRMAASWSYSLNAPQFYDRSGMVPEIGQGRIATGRWVAISPLYRGHHTAIQIANDDSRGDELNFKLGDTIWIANGVDHGEGEYSAAIEAGLIRLRAANLPGAPVTRTVDMVNARFGEDISPRAAEKLKTLKIGGQDAT